jgi:hypothetical protein
MDSSTSGDRIIQQALELVPAGSTVRLMGIQNIKGTGLDFAYQWVFWRELHRDIQASAIPRRATARSWRSSRIRSAPSSRATKH